MVIPSHLLSSSPSPPILLSPLPRQSELDETLPVRAPVWREGPPFTPSTARMTWLGHATTLAEVDGSTFLCDPVFSSRASLCQVSHQGGRSLLKEEGE